MSFISYLVALAGNFSTIIRIGDEFGCHSFPVLGRKPLDFNPLYMLLTIVIFVDAFYQTGEVCSITDSLKVFNQECMLDFIKYFCHI